MENKIKTTVTQVKEWTKAHKKGIIITVSAVTGAVLAYVGYKNYKGNTTGVGISGDEMVTILSEVPVNDLTEEVEVFEELVEKM